jgi:hypothetical protein
MTTRRSFVHLLLTSAVTAISSLLFSVPASATTVVALIDKHHHRVVLAADSLLGRYYAKTTDQGCKLIVTPSCAFAMAGFLDKPDPYFHLQDLGEAACQVQGTLKDQADAFLDIATDPVTSIAQYLHDNESQFYSNTFSKNGGEFSFVVFVGTEHGKPVAYARGFKVASDGSATTVSNDITGTAASGFFAGVTDHIATYLKATPNWAHMDTVALARKLIGLEIAAHPDSVGPPVSILTVDRKGKQHWIDQGVCGVQPSPQAANP